MGKGDGGLCRNRRKRGEEMRSNGRGWRVRCSREGTQRCDRISENEEFEEGMRGWHYGILFERGIALEVIGEKGSQSAYARLIHLPAMRHKQTSQQSNFAQRTKPLKPLQDEIICL